MKKFKIEDLGIKLRHVHLMVAKGTIEYGPKYDMNKKINLEGYVDLY